MNTQPTAAKPIVTIGGIEYGIIESERWNKIPVEDAEVVSETSEVEKIPGSIPEDVYEEFAEKLYDAIGSKDNAQGVVFIAERGDMTYRMECSVIVYREKVICPDTSWDEIVKLVSIWYEFHTYIGEDLDEIMNDGLFERVETILINNQHSYDTH